MHGGRPPGCTRGRCGSPARWSRPGGPGLLERFADEAYHIGRGKEAAAALREAVEIHRTRGDLLRQGDALRQLANQLFQNGAVAEARAAVSEAVTVLEQLPPGPELARTYSTMAAVLGARDDDAPSGGENERSHWPSRSGAWTRWGTP